VKTLFPSVNVFGWQHAQPSRTSAESIRLGGKLDLKDFDSRFLVVDDRWIPVGASLLIQKFKPIWNVALDGFGNFDHGGGRRPQNRSPCDTLHPGRAWGAKQFHGEKSAQASQENLKRVFAPWVNALA